MYVYSVVVTCGSCSATSNSVTVTVSPSPSVTINAQWFDEPVRWVFEWADAHIERGGMHEHGDVPVADQRQPDQRSDIFKLHGAEWLERGDVRVLGRCHVRQLQCDVEQCDGDRQPIAERDDQCQWFDEPVRWVFEWADAHIERGGMHEHGDVPVADQREPDQRSDIFKLHGAEWLECGDVRVLGRCHVRQLQCDVEQCDGDRQPIAERDDQCQWFDEPVRWVFERADADLERGGLHEHGDVPVADQRQPDQRSDIFKLHGAEWLECGDVHVHAGCHVRQLQCDVEQCDGDRQPIAERDDQCQWFDEPVRWVFERADAHIERGGMHEHGNVPVARERQPDQRSDIFKLHGTEWLECGDVRVQRSRHVRQLQCDVEQCDGDRQPDPKRDNQLFLESEFNFIYTDEYRSWYQLWQLRNELCCWRK
ncbi:MAG: hypothetical protein KatS3mg038_1058 [Candidatus Kapaibacterium sp.]|nr:MAG: hypothetical protein KatS3mg038_1058 [Candidatus Kapabacteria bacterium]